MRKEHDVPNGTTLVCRNDALCSGCAYEQEIAQLEADSELLAEVRAIVQKSPRLYRSTQVWQLLGDADA